MENILVEPLIPSLSSGETSMSVSSTAPVSSLGESDSFAEIPWWAQWTSTVILSLIFVIGLPLNGATVLIFWRRKKLRHLVNFVLLLDCLSHIVLCLLCIPMHLLTEWSGSTSLFSGLPSSLGVENLSAIANMQHVIGNFVNLYSTFLTLSIAILRYRRLCWKKKDKFSTMNALKWSVCSAILAIAVTFIQFYVVMKPESGSTVAIVYLAKISLILFAVLTVIFCYVRVSQRVWANTANQEKTMDPAKLKKSRSVHMKATIHSCVQIALVILTVAPHLYLQALEMVSASGSFFSSGPRGVVVEESHQAAWSGGASNNIPSSISEPLAGAAAPHQQLFSIHPQLHHHHHHQQQPQYQHDDTSGVVAGGWMDSSTMAFSSSHRQSPHYESFSASSSISDGAASSSNSGNGILHSALDVISNTSSTTTGDSSGDNFGGGGGAQGIPVGIAATAAAAATLTFGASQLARLIAITVNYALLALGTPCAYIASCHRFREQFTSILFSHAPNSPQNSTYHHGHHNHSSPSHKAHHHHRDRYHYHHRSTTGGTQDACFSSPLNRADTRTSTTLLPNHSSLMSRASGNGHGNGHRNGIARESVSISISANTRSSFSHSFKSRSSMRKESVGSSTKRRRSSSSAVCGIGSSVSGAPSGGKGLLGVSIAADSVFMESDSALILEQDTSNGSSSTGNLNKPSPSPTVDHDHDGGYDDHVSGQGSSSGELVVRKSSSSTSSSHHHLPAHLTAVTTITSSNSSNLNTYLQSYGDYECGTDLGQLV